MSRDDHDKSGQDENLNEDASPPDEPDAHSHSFGASIVSFFTIGANRDRADNLVQLDRWNLVLCGWFDKRGTLYPVFRLSGLATGHPTHADGTSVTTNQITSCKGRIVGTASGRQYILSIHPDPQYLEARLSFDPNNPLRGINFEF